MFLLFMMCVCLISLKFMLCYVICSRLGDRTSAQMSPNLPTEESSVGYLSLSELRPTETQRKHEKLTSWHCRRVSIQRFSFVRVRRRYCGCTRRITHVAWSVITRSSATAEKQRVSCACVPRLANWSCNAQNTAESQRLYYFWHSNALIQEVLAQNAFCHQNSHWRSFNVIHFAIICRSTRGSISSYNVACRRPISEVFEDVAT